jgi:hypothetical protein
MQEMKYIRLVGVFCWIFCGHISFASATTTGIIPSSVGKKIKDGTVALTDIPVVIIHFIDFLTEIAGTVAVIFILYAGFQFITSGLNESAREEAKKTIQYAIIGLVVALLSWVIVNVIQVQMTA